MPWEPAQSSSRASNRWRPPSPSPAAPPIPMPTLKRESWRPTSSWTPVTRPTQPEPLAAESSRSQAGRAPIPNRGSIDRSLSPLPYRARESRPVPDDDAEYGRRGHGSKRDKRGGGGSGGGGVDGSGRSWEAWKHKVEAVSAKRLDDDRRPGPSRRDDRRDDYTNYDRMREQKDQATGRSWSAWQSKVGTGTDDRDRRQPDTGSRDRDRGGRERDEGWKARSKVDDDDRQPGSDRRGPDERESRATSRDNHDGRSRLDERDDGDDGPPPARRRPRESKEKSALPYSPGSRSPSPPSRKRSPSPVKRRKDESPKRGTGRRASPDYNRAPVKSHRSPSPPPARRRVPDRGSPDYALGAEERERTRDRDPDRSAARLRPRDSDVSASTSLRHRSPSPPTRARRHESPEARPRDRSPSASSVSSVSSRRRDHSAGDRPPVGPGWRRERSPEDKRPAPARGPSEDRHKRPRRESPDYAPRRPTSPGPKLPPTSPNVPKDTSHHGGKSGPPMPHQANHHNEAGARRESWARDRPSPDDALFERGNPGPPQTRPRGLRRDSPDYDGHGTGPVASRNDSRSDQRAHDIGRSKQPLNPNQIAVTRTWGRPQNPSVPGTLPASDSQTPPTPPTTRPWNGSNPSENFPPVSGFHATSSQAGNSPIKGSSSPVKIDFGPTTSPKASVVSGKRAPGLRQFFDADSPAQQEFISNPPSGSHTPNTLPPSARDNEAEMEADTPSIDVSLQTPDVYLHKIAESEKQYTQHLDTIAPYIRSAFKEWSEQDQTQSLPAFLVHYFGRQPDERELHQIEQLNKLRHRTSKDQAGLRDLHARATKDTKQHRTKGATNATAMSPARRSPGRNGHDRTVSKAESTTEAGKTPVDSQDSHIAGRRTHTDETYERLACVGEGTYGKVYKARRVDDGVFVALKRIRMEVEKDGFPVTAMREIKLLQSLKHDNIIRLHEMMVSKGSVYMVFDYMEHDLTGLLSHPGISFSPANIKSLNHQMLSGLGYLHRVGILHRDMKGSNILLTAQGELKLADFGLARLYNRKRKADYTNRVITLWYRSPELLLGETAYGPEVDMWSAGCIMLEIYYTKPILQGNDEIHQLEVIYGLMGTPREEDWPTVRDLPWYELVKPKTELRSKFKESFSKRLSPAAMELAEGLLAMNPAKRLTAKKALQTAYFVSEEPTMEKPAQLAGIGEHHEMSAKQERHRRKAEGQ